MRLSIVSFLLLFLSFGLYLGWAQGAFDFNRIEVKPLKGTEVSAEGVTNQPLKSASQPPMKEPEVSADIAETAKTKKSKMEKGRAGL